MKVHIENLAAVSVNEAVDKAFASFGIAPLGGASADGWSKTSDLQRCAYRFYLRHERQLDIDPDMRSRASSGALEVGGLVHICLALHYGRMLPEGYPGWRKNQISPFEFMDRVIEMGAESNFVNEALRIYSGYAEHYGYETDIRPVAIEYAAGQPGIHTCRFDMLAWWDGGGTSPPGLWNFEAKTTSRETSDVLEGWWLDGEIVGQHYVFQKFGLEKIFHAPLQGTVINLMIKNHPPRYRRLEIVQAPVVIESYALDRAYWQTYRDHCRNTGNWPRSLAGCMNRYGPCEYWSHCRDMNNNYLVPIKKLAPPEST